MKFSIITPEHDTSNIPFLVELYESILSQTYSDWEWVLYLNNGFRLVDLPTNIINNKKVVIHVDESNNSEIGYLKNRAFFKGEGEILVEADHDDILLPNCLEELYNVYIKNPDIGFVYSDNITYKMDGAFIPYSGFHGWTSYTHTFRGLELPVMRSFEPSSHSLAYIWYAPDHVRSWRKDIYVSLGGHEESLSICDDHDLLARTYITTKMYRIPKPLYVYRITGENTYLKRNEEIQHQTRILFDKYIRELAEKDADSKNLLKIDIGGGLNPYSNYKTVDIRETADIVADLNEGIPLEDNSVGVLNAHHILEHLKDPIKSMREIHRVLCHGGWAFIEVPSTEGKGAFQDPTHITFWNDNSFLYYTDKELATFIDNTDIRFQQYKKTNYYPNQRMKELDVLVTCVVLVAIKEDTPRYPGLLSI